MLNISMAPLKLHTFDIMQERVRLGWNVAFAFNKNVCWMKIKILQCFNKLNEAQLFYSAESFIESPCKNQLVNPDNDKFTC